MAFCPLLYEDTGGAIIPEKLPILRTNKDGEIEGGLPQGYCSADVCRYCEHLLERLHTSLVLWVCAECLDEYPGAAHPGFYSDGPCEVCGETSIVLQVIIL